MLNFEVEFVVGSRAGRQTERIISASMQAALIALQKKYHGSGQEVLFLRAEQI